MTAWAWLLELLFPPKCLFCRQVLFPGAERICPACRKRLTGMRLDRTGTHFKRCCVSMRYEGTVRDAILRYKFQDRDAYAGPLGEVLAQTVRQELAGQYELITWTPISEKRRRQRGYDQARLLAEAAAEALGETAVEMLRKTVDNPAQSSLDSAAARRENVKHVYEAVDPDAIRGRRILIIDDLVTTGATLDEAARVLLAAGAREVVAAALAAPVT